MNKLLDILAKVLLWIGGAAVFFVAGWIMRELMAKKTAKAMRKV